MQSRTEPQKFLVLIVHSNCSKKAPLLVEIVSSIQKPDTGCQGLFVKSGKLFFGKLSQIQNLTILPAHHEGSILQGFSQLAALNHLILDEEPQVGMDVVTSADMQDFPPVVCNQPDGTVFPIKHTVSYLTVL